MKKSPYQKGMTLIEMIVVVAIFALIIFVIYSIYVLSQQSYREGDKMAEVTQNGRVALERLSREIRQARTVVTEIPEENLNPPSEIEFQDGHTEQAETQWFYGTTATSNTITLQSASKLDNVYNEMYIKITNGKGAGQIRKIVSYSGTTHIAQIEGTWDLIPDSSSSYLIDSYYYYVHYYLSGNNLLRKVVTYCFSQDSINCVQPESYVPWNATPPQNQFLIEVVLEQPLTVSEYVKTLEFWGGKSINVSMDIENNDKNINLQTEITGRNL